MDPDKTSKTILKALGLKLREIREGKGWTLEDAEEHGWPSWQHLQKVESGKNITVLTLIKLTRLYRIRLGDLFRDL